MPRPVKEIKPEEKLEDIFHFNEDEIQPGLDSGLMEDEKGMEEITAESRKQKLLKRFLNKRLNRRKLRLNLEKKHEIILLKQLLKRSRKKN